MAEERSEGRTKCSPVERRLLLSGVIGRMGGTGDVEASDMGDAARSDTLEVSRETRERQRKEISRRTHHLRARLGSSTELRAELRRKPAQPRSFAHRAATDRRADGPRLSPCRRLWPWWGIRYDTRYRRRVPFLSRA